MGKRSHVRNLSPLPLREKVFCKADTALSFCAAWRENFYPPLVRRKIRREKVKNKEKQVIIYLSKQNQGRVDDRGSMKRKANRRSNETRRNVRARRCVSQESTTKKEQWRFFSGETARFSQNCPGKLACRQTTQQMPGASVKQKTTLSLDSTIRKNLPTE